MPSIFLIVFLCGWSFARSINEEDSINSWVKEWPITKTINEGAVQPIEDVWHRLTRESQKEKVSDVVKQLEGIFKSLIPNNNMVQDLMGLPEPDSDSDEISQRIQTILNQPVSPAPAQYSKTLSSSPATLPAVRKIQTDQQNPNLVQQNPSPALSSNHITKQSYHIQTPFLRTNIIHKNPLRQPFYNTKLLWIKKNRIPLRTIFQAPNKVNRIKAPVLLHRFEDETI